MFPDADASRFSMFLSVLTFFSGAQTRMLQKFNVYPVESLVTLGQNFSWRAELDFDPPAGAYVWSPQTAVWQETTARLVGRSAVVKFIAYVTWEQVANFPSTIKFSVRDASGRDISSTVYMFSFGEVLGACLVFANCQKERCCGRFLQNQTAMPLNVLLFGMAGSGKSSFINACYSMMNSEKKSVAPSGGGDGHNTTSFRRYRLANISTKTPSQIHLFDTWGLTPTTYAPDGFGINDAFLRILSGQLGKDFKMTDMVPNPGLGMGVTNQENKIHCVAFCLPLSEMFASSPSPITKRTREFVAVCAEEGLVLLCVQDCFRLFVCAMLCDRCVWSSIG